METIRKGELVFWRRRDLFGIVVEDEQDGSCLVKLEWPWDPAAPAERAPVEQLTRRGFDYEVW